MARTRTTRTTAARASKQDRSGEVIALRKKLGELAGKKKVSREGLAKLLGVSPGTVRNWEVGEAISARMDERLRELAKRAAKGDVEVPTPREAPQRPRKTMAKTALARGAKVTPSERLVFYANEVKVIEGVHDVRLRFSLVLPGEHSPTTVHEVVLPNVVFDGLRTLPRRDD